MKMSKSKAMLWLDKPTDRTTLEDRLAPAVTTYTKKNRSEPGVIYMRPDMIPTQVATIAGMHIIPYAKLPPYHVVLCSQKEDFFKTTTED